MKLKFNLSLFYSLGLGRQASFFTHRAWGENEVYEDENDMRFFSQWPCGPRLPGHSAFCFPVSMTKRAAANDLSTVAELMDFFVRDENKAYIAHNKRLRLQVAALREENSNIREELVVVSDHRDGLDNECFRLEGELMEKEYQVNELREQLRRAKERVDTMERWLENMKRANNDLAEVMKLSLPHVPAGVLPRGTPMLVRTQIPLMTPGPAPEVQLESSESLEPDSSSDESEELWRQDFNREREDV